MFSDQRLWQNQLDAGRHQLSGIAAILNLDGSTIPESELVRMANVLRPYGPDRQKILVRGNAGFVFCLHHLTPEDLYERQPMLLADRFVMLFDGRIDNRSELGQILGIATSELHSISDGMIALRLFDRWGELGFERIRGVFAIIVMDLQDGHLICMRDHMGLRVLHYYRSPKRFAVATVPEALFALSWVPRILNRDKVGDTLVHRGLNGETTYYREINRVLPGCIIRLRGRSFSKKQYWSLEDAPDIRLKSDDEYVAAFQEHFATAVEASLRCRGVPCASMTGGLDSSSVAVIAADMLAKTGQKLNTFTAVPELGFKKEEKLGRYFDEAPYVRRIAEGNPNIVPHFIPPTKRPVLEHIAEQIRVAGAPVGGVVNGLWTMDILAAARSAGHSVMLSGEMGNLTMSYTGHALFAELLRTGRWWRLFVEITSSGFRWKQMIRHYTIAPLVPKPVFRLYKHLRRNGLPPWYDTSAIHPKFAARSGVVDRAAREYLPFDAPPPGEGRLHRINDVNSYSETADWFARLRASFGIDVRTPAFDRRIVEFCIGIPHDQYLCRGNDRWLIRRAMKKRLPEVILAKKKWGAQAPDWFRRLTRERDYIRAEVNRLAGNAEVASIIDLERLTTILDYWPDHEPEYQSQEAYAAFVVIPQALGAAAFIENIAGTNYGPM